MKWMDKAQECHELGKGTLGCSTGICSTIQNGVSSTTGMSGFWEKKSIYQCERERENESRTKH
jgi:hypothetical protein